MGTGTSKTQALNKFQANQFDQLLEDLKKLPSGQLVNLRDQIQKLINTKMEQTNTESPVEPSEEDGSKNKPGLSGGGKKRRKKTKKHRKKHMKKTGKK